MRMDADKGEEKRCMSTSVQQYNDKNASTSQHDDDFRHVFSYMLSLYLPFSLCLSSALSVSLLFNVHHTTRVHMSSHRH